MAKRKIQRQLRRALERLFKPKTPPLVGADISSSAIKMVEIAEAGKGIYRVERYAIEPLAQGLRRRRQHQQHRRGERRAEALPQAPRHQHQEPRARAAQRGGHQQEDPRARPARREEDLELAGRDRGEPVHSVLARRGEPRLPGARPGAQQPGRRRGADRRLAQGEDRGPRGGRRGRRGSRRR